MPISERSVFNLVNALLITQTSVGNPSKTLAMTRSERKKIKCLLQSTKNLCYLSRNKS